MVTRLPKGSVRLTRIAAIRAPKSLVLTTRVLVVAERVDGGDLLPDDGAGRGRYNQAEGHAAESRSRVTANAAPFVPHVILD